VTSKRPESRNHFAGEMSDLLGKQVLAVGTTEETVRDLVA
jgi:hypothetical protein